MGVIVAVAYELGVEITGSESADDSWQMSSYRTKNKR